jgi:hypothetical protein
MAAITTGKKNILRNWFEPGIALYRFWLLMYLDIAQLERVTARLCGAKPKLWFNWSHAMSHLQELI